MTKDDRAFANLIIRQNDAGDFEAAWQTAGQALTTDANVKRLAFS